MVASGLTLRPPALQPRVGPRLPADRPPRHARRGAEHAGDVMTEGRCIAVEPPRVCRRIQLLRDWGMRQAEKYSPQVREQAVRLVFEHEREYPSRWAAIQSIAEKIGCSGETTRSWVRQAERALGERPGPTTAERERIEELERQSRELRRAREILPKVAALFAQARSWSSQR